MWERGGSVGKGERGRYCGRGEVVWERGSSVGEGR